MEKQIKINDRIVDFNLKLSEKARYLRLSICRNSSLIVTMPLLMNYNFVEKFLIKKAKWIFKNIDLFKNNRYEVRDHEKEKQLYGLHKKDALRLAQERIKKFNELYNFGYKKIFIKNQRTRWGSCSKKGNLNFNYKVAFLPEKLANYLIVHELCHLKELNHSEKFWRLVKQTIPDYVQLRKELRKIDMEALPS